MKQSTIARPIEWDGLGLHSGIPVRVEMSPSAANSGIVFVRAGEVAGADVEIPALHGSLYSGSRATTLAANAGGAREARIATVEHLLATLYSLEIDNLRVRVDGPELPAMDGSARPLVDRVNAAGREHLPADRGAVTIFESVEIQESGCWIRAEPADRLQLTYSIDFDHPMIGCQTLALRDFDRACFARELASARTFGFLHEWEALRSAGLARGGSLENTVVLDDEGVLNEDGLRFPDEFVRHKVVDLIGDLALLGAPLRAHVSVEGGGHALHHRLVRAIAELATPAHSG
ncbi:MAG: UDP-3-O-[3-hydroxymyristoyl] N-acetylglucosamine deacetylase [bacterium]|nr:UDP-3-O-[3-hydroxymyristoyl] N-acetylglucosamine deacetylase [bacterium]